MSVYTNPIIRGVNPDPSICRVGEDFYLATSSMFFFPGVPIYHSRDLVNWRLVGHALTRAEHFCLDRNNGSPMMYAPTLRHQGGVFYMITTDVNGGGNFFVTATDPAEPWSDPVFVYQPMFDPSLFFDDDGTVYYTRRGDIGDKNIVQARIDLGSGKLLEPLRSVGRGMVSEDTEGPHLFKAHGWYYLTCGEGGSRFLHMQTIGRSRSPWGPFERCPHNPVISQHNAWWHPFKSLGHADFIEDSRGQWWAVCLGTRHADYNSFSAIGRETFLFPVQWVDGWPVIEPTLMHGEPVNAPLPDGEPWTVTPGADDFDARNLGPQWIQLAYPHQSPLSLSDRPGWLRLFARYGRPFEAKPSAFIGVRQSEFNCSLTTRMQFDPHNETDEAGLMVFQTGEFNYAIFKTVRAGKTVVTVRKTVGDIIVESPVFEVPAGEIIQLRVRADAAKYYFEWARDTKRPVWQLIDTARVQLITTELAGVWSGVLIGPYAAGNNTSAHADFDWCRYVNDVPTR